MGTPVNEFDIALQAVSPRLVEVSSNYIALSPSSTSFALKASGYVPATITIQATLVGSLKGTVAWSATGGTVNGNVLTLTPSNLTGNSLTVTASLNYLGVTYTKSVTITKIAETSVLSLSSEAIAIQTAQDGTADASAYSLATTTASISVGNVDDSANWSYSWSSPPAGVVVTLSNSNRTLKVDSMSAAVDTAQFTVTATKAGLPTLTKAFTITKAKQGLDSTVYYIESSSPVIAKDAPDASTAGTYSTVTVTGRKALGTAPPSAYGFLTATADGDAEASIATANSLTIAPLSTSGKSAYTVRLYNQATVSLATLLDTQTISVVYKGLNGAGGISVILSNEAQSLTASSLGVVSSYAGTGTEIRVYEGATLLTYDGAGTSNGTWKVTASGNNITASASITGSGAYATIGNASSMLSTSDAASITYSITGKSNTGTSFTATKTQVFSKSKQGIQGIQGIQGETPSTTDFLTTYSSYVLTGSGGIKAGNLTWNTTTGALTGGSGIALTSKGLLGAKYGAPTFTILDDGSATFRGDINTAGDVVAEGNTTSGVQQTINATSFTIDYSIFGRAADSPSTNRMRVGLLGSSTGSSSTGYSVGTIGLGASTGNTIGVLGSSGSIGGWFEGKSSSWAALYAVSSVAGGGVAIKAIGSIQATGDVIAFTTSDRNLKTNIVPIQNALSKVVRLSGVTFDWKDSYLQRFSDSLHSKSLVRKEDAGVIAQEVAEVLPEAVHVREDGSLAVKYDCLIPLLLESIKELKGKLDVLERKIDGSTFK